jgi:hypothetical protein
VILHFTHFGTLARAPESLARMPRRTIRGGAAGGGGVLRDLLSLLRGRLLGLRLRDIFPLSNGIDLVPGVAPDMRNHLNASAQVVA